MKVKKKSVKEQAQENLNIVRKHGRDAETEKQGSFVDHSRKHLEEDTVGASIGTTMRMGDYESLRVDVWATVSKNGRSTEEAFNELIGVLDAKLRETVEKYTDD